jgi:hypothetical protein
MTIISKIDRKYNSLDVYRISSDINLELDGAYFFKSQYIKYDQEYWIEKINKRELWGSLVVIVTKSERSFNIELYNFINQCERDFKLNSILKD